MSSIGDKINKFYTNGPKPNPINILEGFLISESITMNEKLKNPFYLTWNITNNCNLKCIYCANEGNYTTHEILDNFNIIKAIDKIEDLGIKHIRLLGGEPTLISNFNKIIDLILSKKIYLSMSTNGTGINKETVNILKKYSPLTYSINVSLDSINADENALNRGENSYNIAIKAINMLNSIDNINLTVFSVFTKNNIHSIYQTYQELNKMKIKHYGGTIALLRGLADTSMILDISEDILDILIKIKNYADEKEDNTKFYFNLGYRASNEVSYTNKTLNISDVDSNIIFRRKCNAGVTRLHMESNGDIYPCDNLKFPQFFLGNIIDIEKPISLWENTIIDMIWNIRRNNKENCKSCIHKSCTTGCMGLAYQEHRTLLINDPNCKLLNE